MVYIVVLMGSLIGLSALLAMRIAMRYRAVRKFVRSIRERSGKVKGGAACHTVPDTPLERPRKNARTMHMVQEVRALERQAEKATAHGKYDEAEKLYIRALTVDPRAHDTQTALAKLYLTTDRDAKAEALYKEILMKIEDAACYANLGLVLYKQGKYAEACAAYERALEKDPSHAQRTFALGRCYMATGQYDLAAPLLERASIRLSRDTVLLRLLAECYMHIKDIDSAEATYRRINKLEPYDEEIKAKLVALAA